MMLEQRPINVLTLLSSRETCDGTRAFRRRLRYWPYAGNAILKEIILDAKSEFRLHKVIQNSHKRIFYSQQRCFTNDYSRSEPSWSAENDGRGRWDNERFPTRHVKENALLMQFPANHVQTDAQGIPHHKNSIIGIRKQLSQDGQQMLNFIDIDSGHVWNQVALPGCGAGCYIKYWQELEWNNVNESICVRSQMRHPSLCGGQDQRSLRRAEDTRTVPPCILDYFVTFVLYRVQPLEPLAFFSLYKSSFVERPLSATVQNDVLMTTHRDHTVQLRSLLDLFDYNSEITLFDRQAIPQQIRKMPPALYHVTTKNQFLSLGGFPWHALVQVDKWPTQTKPGHKYALIDLSSEETTGYLGTTTRRQLLLSDNEQVGFRDELREVLFKGPDKLEVFDIKLSNMSSDRSFTLQPKYTITPQLLFEFPGSIDGNNKADVVSTPPVTVTKSGRLVKKRELFDWGESWFYSFGYEDELCLSYVVFVDRRPGIEGVGSYGCGVVSGDNVKKRGSSRRKNGDGKCGAHRKGRRDGDSSSSGKGRSDAIDDRRFGRVVSDEAAFVCLIDDNSGAILKKIPLAGWEDDSIVKENEVEMDLSTIVHNIRYLDGKNKVLIYQLFRR